MKLRHVATITLAASALALPAIAKPGDAGHFSWNKDRTSGWSLMSAQERAAHQTQMRTVKTYDECKALQEEHHKTMQARAKEKGVTLSPARQNGCDAMKARGILQ